MDPLRKKKCEQLEKDALRKHKLGIIWVNECLMPNNIWVVWTKGSSRKQARASLKCLKEVWADTNWKFRIAKYKLVKL